MRKKILNMTEIKDARQEMHFRKIRNMVLYSVTVILAIVSISSVIYFNRHKDDNVIKTDTVSIWLSDDSFDEKTVGVMLEEFATQYSQITTDVRIIQSEQYYDLVEDAIIHGDGPDIFEWDMSDSTIDEYKFNLTELYERLKTEGYRLPDSHYVIPLTYSKPLLYYNSNYITENEASQLSDSAVPTDINDFLAEETYIFMGSTEDYSQIQSEMAGKYSLAECKDDTYTPVQCLCVNNNSTNNRKRASIEVLYYMLSDNAQMYYSIIKGNGIPANPNIETYYWQVNTELK